MKYIFGIIWLATLTVSIWAYVTPKTYTSNARTVGKLLSFNGDVFVREPYQSIWKNVLAGNQFTSGTFISTGKKSSAEIEIEGSYNVNIPPESQVSLDVQTGNKNQLVLNIISGELTVLKPAKKESSFFATLSRKYTEMTLDNAPISISAAGSTYALTTEVTKAQFQKKDDGVNLVFSDGKINNKEEATEIAPTSVPIAIASTTTVSIETPDPAIELETEEETEEEKDTEWARVESIKHITEKLTTLKAELKIKPYSFIRLKKSKEDSTKKNVVLEFKGTQFSTEYQYPLTISGDSNFKQVIMPISMTNNQLTYQVPQAQIELQVQRFSGKFEMNYELNVVSLEMDQDISAAIDKGTIMFVDIKNAALSNILLDLYHSPVPFNDEEWQPRFGAGADKPQYSFQFYTKDSLPKMLQNSYQNYGFNFIKPTKKDSFGIESNATIFIKDGSPVLVSSKTLDSDRLSALKKDVNFDFIYDGKLRDFFRSGKDFSSSGSITTANSIYFPQFLRKIQLPAALSSIQKKSLLEQLDSPFLLNQKERLSNLEPFPLIAPQEIEKPFTPKRVTVIEKQADGTFTINPSKYERLFIDLELTSAMIIRANFAVNSLKIEKMVRDSPTAENLARFILDLDQSDYVMVVSKSGENNELTIMRQKNSMFIKESFKDLKDSNLKKTVEDFFGYDCLAKSDGPGKAILSYQKSTSDQKTGIYIWKDSAQDEQLDQQIRSLGTPLLAICEQPLKDGCYARVIPKVAFDGVLKCSSSNSLNAPTLDAH